jgi:hypothetical protein
MITCFVVACTTKAQAENLIRTRYRVKYNGNLYGILDTGYSIEEMMVLGDTSVSDFEQQQNLTSTKEETVVETKYCYIPACGTFRCNIPGNVVFLSESEVQSYIISKFPKDASITRLSNNKWFDGKLYYGYHTVIVDS